MAKSLWASVAHDPQFMMKFNGYMTILWIVMIPVSIGTGWVNSVPYVSALSIYALITGHMSTWQASRVEVKQEQEADRRDDEAPERIERKVDQINLDVITHRAKGTLPKDQ